MAPSATQQGREARVARPMPDIIHELLSKREMDCLCGIAGAAKTIAYTFRGPMLIETVTCACGRAGTRHWVPN